jgi:hypothetical protein
MKLYTEEQVRETLKLMGLDLMVNEFLKKAEPIELPSDEYIDEVFQPMTELHQYYKDGFINGAKWMKEQILNQNK